MNEITRILTAVDAGDPRAAEQLLPLVYEELRKLATVKLAQEKPGQTLEATALVHEAYLRLVNVEKARHWDSRGHFFAAAAQAMRRILVDQARHKQSRKAGGQIRRLELSEVPPEWNGPDLDLVALDEALERLAQHDSRAAEVVELRFFAGLTVAEAATALSVSVATVENDWAYAKSWLRLQLVTPGNAR
jgi:RNA polymerase sigma factor (TIGR02999 family)